MPYSCRDCGNEFTVAESSLARFPGWTPTQCLGCRDAAPQALARPARPSAPRPYRPAQVLTLAEVLEKFHEGPKDGLFTDGSAQPNPGPGGWGVVWVKDDEVVAEKHGHEAPTTNNRMELTGVIEAYLLVPPGEPATIYTDSELVANTVNLWARKWAAAGWKRKTGPIKNLDLVQRLHELALAAPHVKIEWVRGHAGWRWNEYADALSTAYTRATP